MRGDDPRNDSMFSYVTPEARVRPDHPLRPIRRMTDAALTQLSARFDRLYSTTGRPSIPPEKLLRALLLQLLYSIRSERLLMEELDYNILYRWFVGLSLDDAVWDATTFTKNRDRLLEGDVANAFFAEVLAAIKADGLLSDEHFSVDGTLLEAWASHKSFKPKDGPPSEPPAGRNVEVAWRGEKRANDTHASTTDPEARLYRKSRGTPARLCYAGHLLMEHRSALIVDAELTTADGYAERATATEMLARLPATARRRTVAGDKAYDTRGFVADVRGLGFTPHVAPNTSRPRSAIDARTTRHPGHQVSQRIRKRIEEPFGWIKTIAGGRKLRYRGRQRNRAWFRIAAATYNLLRITALDTRLA